MSSAIKHKTFSRKIKNSGENLSVFSVLFFSISTNVFAFLVTTDTDKLIFIGLSIFSIIFLVSGFYFNLLFRRVESAKQYARENPQTVIDQDIKEFGDDDPIAIQRLYQSLEDSIIFTFRSVYYFPIVGLILGVVLLSNNFLDLKETVELSAKSCVQHPHEKKILDVYHQFSLNHRIYEHQSEFIDSIISKYSLDSCLAIDALCCYGVVMKEVQEQHLSKGITVKGCYNSRASYKYCRDSMGIKKNHLVKTEWIGIDSVFTQNDNCNLIYLFNNSLAELNDTAYVLSIFKKFYNVLSEEGVFVLDFENTSRPYQTLADEANKGIKRVRNGDKSDRYNVEYHYYDVKSGIDSVIFSRPHYKSLTQQRILQMLLKNAGFSEVNFSGKIDNYPFEFIEAKK